MFVSLCHSNINLLYILAFTLWPSPLQHTVLRLITKYWVSQWTNPLHWTIDNFQPLSLELKPFKKCLDGNTFLNRIDTAAGQSLRSSSKLSWCSFRLVKNILSGKYSKTGLWLIAQNICVFVQTASEWVSRSVLSCALCRPLHFLRQYHLILIFM